MAETRIITPGSLANFVGFIEAFIGSIDDNSLKGDTIGVVAELTSGPTGMQIQLSSTILNDFIGQQILLGTTLYRLEDATFDSSLSSWTWPPDLSGTDLQDALGITTVPIIFDFNQSEYIPPKLITPYGNQGTLVGDSVNIDLNPNFVLANDVSATNLPPGLSETDGVITGTLTDNTGPFVVLVTATNTTGTTTATFTWNTYVIGPANFITTPITAAITSAIVSSVLQPKYPLS